MEREQELPPPHGLAEILAAFGEIYRYLLPDGSLDPRWQQEFLVQISLPFPMRLAWDTSRSVMQMTCHRSMAEIFGEVFGRIQVQGLQSKIETFGGCFSFRPQRRSSKLSTHCWGIAIDLNPDTNRQGSEGNMDPALIGVFREAGFEWGGEWQGKSRDPMHLQYCTGY